MSPPLAATSSRYSVETLGCTSDGQRKRVSSAGSCEAAADATILPTLEGRDRGYLSHDHLRADGVSEGIRGGSERKDGHTVRIEPGGGGFTDHHVAPLGESEDRQVWPIVSYGDDDMVGEPEASADKADIAP